ncbi:MAG: SufS family cysteine desulfurase [Candidatus Brockarchaeota archaeon]|nr:SufS family cysteine desulfurase [Candidatus Brockarchaeota archaeon]MBO3808201.1 SufS family cysteine desulfurase [Candidatus Brockarchaeota archaeon]
MPLDPYTVREDFPILKRVVNGKSLVYFNNAATTQKPVQVVEAIKDYYYNYNSDVLRSVNTLSSQATDLYMEARRKIAGFIGAGEDEIVFTRNTTEGLNMVAEALSERIGRGSVVVTSIMEHHSNLLPWRRILARKGGRLTVVGMNRDFTIDMDMVEKSLEEGCEILATLHVSNVLGTVNPVNELSKLAHKHGCLFILDAAQSVPHMPFNVKDVDPDATAFSGHKMLGPTGIGVLYVKRSILEEVEPMLLGGGMVKTVTLETQVYEDIPFRFEAGTPNVEGVIGLAAAVDYLRKIGLENIAEHESKLVKHLLEGLDRSFVEVYGPGEADKHAGILSFNVKGVHPHDVAQFLDADGIMIRSGALCAEPLVNALGVSAVARVSFYLYNTLEEVDMFHESLRRMRLLI